MASKMNVHEIKKSFSRYDICIITKFSVLLGKSATDIHTELLTAIGDHAPSIQTIRKWMKAISEGRIDMDDDSRSGQPRPEKARRKQGSLKIMHIIFFDSSGVILRWPVPAGTTVNTQYYKMVLQDKLRPVIRKKTPWSSKIWRHIPS